MRGGAARTIAQSPTMVGALTVLIVIVAVFLAYNANTGLPFVPSYRITAQVPDAETLVPKNEVRIGGVRVGQIESIEPRSHEDGSVSADLELKLDDEIRELPADSTVVVRARSALGLKFLEINEGTSSQGLPEGSVLPLSAARPEPVEIDQVLNTFDGPTRRAIKVNLTEFGNAVAGRGPDLNSALGELPSLLARLEPVTRNLARPGTGLGRFFRAARAAAAEVAPVAEQQASSFVSLDVTFGALAEVARPFIQETISRTPPTLEATTESLPRVRPFLRNTAGLFADLRPGARALRRTAPELRRAFAVGTPVVRRSPRLNRRLPPATAALRRFNDNGAARAGLRKLGEASDELSPTLRFITPAQSVCNYGTLLLRNFASTLSIADDGLGSSQRFIVFDPPAGPNNQGSPSSAPANGPSDPANPGNFLHANPYPNTAAPGQQPRECEAGNEPYIAGRQVIGNVPGNQGTETERVLFNIPRQEDQR